MQIYEGILLWIMQVVLMPLLLRTRQLSKQMIAKAKGNLRLYAATICIDLYMSN